MTSTQPQPNPDPNPERTEGVDENLADHDGKPLAVPSRGSLGDLFREALEEADDGDPLGHLSDEEVDALTKEEAEAICEGKKPAKDTFTNSVHPVDVVIRAVIEDNGARLAAERKRIQETGDPGPPVDHRLIMRFTCDPRDLNFEETDRLLDSVDLFPDTWGVAWNEIYRATDAQLQQEKKRIRDTGDLGPPVDSRLIMQYVHNKSQMDPDEYFRVLKLFRLYPDTWDRAREQAQQAAEEGRN